MLPVTLAKKYQSCWKVNPDFIRRKAKDNSIILSNFEWIMMADEFFQEKL